MIIIIIITITIIIKITIIIIIIIIILAVNEYYSLLLRDCSVTNNTANVNHYHYY